MSKKLIIAEKPSVAGDIARALGGFTRKGDYYESEDYVLSSAVGHLLELTLPAEHDVKKGKWSFAKLPVIPPHFELAPIEKNEGRLNVLLRLLKRKDRLDAILIETTGLANPAPVAQTFFTDPEMRALAEDLRARIAPHLSTG